ncbi:hypothetical protein NX059_006171 [Plenodomus lindquistii]|nr:hypothetical protein NX059_006171 [Plenodomus lindquistii]
MACELLSSFLALPPKALRTLAAGTIGHDEIKSADDDGVTNHQRLCELVYYAIGNKLWAQHAFNSMTRLHMIRVLSKQDWLVNGEEDTMSDWDLRFRLFTRTRYAEILLQDQARRVQSVDSASEDGSEATHCSHHSSSS